MFKLEEKVYFKGTEDYVVPFVQEENSEELKKIHFKPQTTNILALVQEETRLALIKHERGYDINVFVDAEIVPEKYRDSNITAILVAESLLEKIM